MPKENAPGTALKILIVEDDLTDRLLLSTIIRNDGHEVVEAINGFDAIEKFIEHQPDLVLMDALMPVMDGIEAASTIKTLSGENMIPVMFLTSLHDAESVAKCLDSGGDDFLTKPYSRIILRSKIIALSRLRSLHNTVLIQRDHIARHNAYLLHEQEVAKAVFNNIAHTGCIDSPNIKHVLSPMAIFNGDILLATKCPSGSIMAFLGDFTGHGLPAAIGAMPVAEIFYGMSQKGFAMDEILKEINKRLVEILPPGVFCCACAVHLDFRRNSIFVWNGGMPDVVVYRANEKSFFTIKSFHLPLGILQADKFISSTQEFEVNTGDRIYLCSDGILEEQNASTEMYGETRYLQVFAKNTDIEKLFNEHIEALRNFNPDSNQNDDHSFVEIIFDEIDKKSGIKNTHVIKEGASAKNWRFEYELRNESLREFNPLPLLIHILRDTLGYQIKIGELYTILAELYSNALDHGVLKLESKIKQTPNGFLDYYSAKEQRLKSIQEECIKFVLDHAPSENGGSLMIEVSDSGDGFNYRSFTKNQSSFEHYSGRGISLIRSLCRTVQFEGKGNKVIAIYDWVFGEK